MSPYIEAIISQCGGIWGKALGGTDFMRMESVWIELVPLQEEAWERWPLPAMWGYKKTPVYNLERELSPESDHVGTLDHGFPASGTVRNKCLLFKQPSPWFLAITAQTKTQAVRTWKVDNILAEIFL